MTARPRRVIVDDTDPQIQYSGDQWELLHIPDTIGGILSQAQDVAGLGLFQNTTHFTNVMKEASSLSFRFQGSSPQVFGAGVEIAYECFIDDTSVGSTFQPFTLASPIDNNGLLCDGTQFVEGREYTLTLNISVLASEDSLRGLYFDYVTYIPPVSAPLGSATVLVDRLDSAIELDGPWNRGDTDNPTIYTQTNGSRLIFNFNGTSVSWVGFTPALNQTTFNVIYSIDNAESISFTHPGLSRNLNISNDLVFTSPTLNPGPHTLGVTYQGNSTTLPLTLNHFIVTNNVSTLAPPPAATSNHKPNPPAPAAAVIGGVVGGVAILCLVIILLWRRHRRRRIGSRERSIIDHDHFVPFPPITPFDSMSSGLAMAEASNGALKVHRAPVVDPPEFNPYDGPDATPQAQDLNRRKSRPRTPPVEMAHEDSGARSATDEPVDPPPSYVSA